MHKGIEIIRRLALATTAITGFGLSILFFALGIISDSAFDHRILISCGFLFSVLTYGAIKIINWIFSR